MRYIAAFGHFWYDFIVGDSVVLALGGVSVLALGWLFSRIGDGVIAEVLVPLVVVATLALSLNPRRRG